MKKFLLYTIFSFAFVLSCTSDFDEINTRPDALTADDVSAKYFVTNTQLGIFAPNRYPYWRGPLIHADRYAGQHAFGYKTNWWSDGLGYTYSGGYTGAVWDWMAGYNSNITSFSNFVKPGGTLENEQYEAISLIMKGLYYQLFSDTFGMVPYSQASNPDITSPAFDDIKTIYEGVIADLDKAIGLIGSNETTGVGPELMIKNDLFFNGDMEMWKALANSLKLKMALRGHGAGGADYSAHVTAAAPGVLGAATIKAKPLLHETIDGFHPDGNNALLPRDTEISQWASAVYGDIWHNFYGGGHWHVGSKLADMLRVNADPRLTKMIRPIKGAGKTYTFTKPASGSNVELYPKHTAFIVNHLKDSGADVTEGTDSSGNVTVTLGAGPYYVGQPVRTNGKIKPFLYSDLWSQPSEIVVQKKNEGKNIFPRLIFTEAESHFLLAQATVLGVLSGNAETHYQNGMKHAMKLWGVTDGDAATYIASNASAKLTGTNEQKLEKIATQRWLAHYTDGYEAWAVIRDTGYPKIYKNYSGTGYRATNTVKELNDSDIFEKGTLNGDFPQRMRYGSGTYNKNGSNTEAANSAQGADVQATKLWWAK